jgi:hypothetical protein
MDRWRGAFAALGSLVGGPGMGQVLAGRTRRGRLWLGLTLVLFAGTSLWWPAMILAFAVMAISLVDSYLVGRRSGSLRVRQLAVPIQLVAGE